MIFSQWNSDGGYTYFESKVRHPIGDDIPVALPAEINGIGVPSQDVGVRLPKDAIVVGEGEEPIGLITPMRRSGYTTLSGTDSKEEKTAMLVVALFVTGVLLAGGLASDGKRR